MKYNQLGNTDLYVSELGFGAATLGNEYGDLDAETGKRAVHVAIDNGINFFDTSPYYGRTVSETRLGDALKGYREKVILATKCGRYGAKEFDFSYKRIIDSVEESLKRLKTDRIDLFQLHDIEFENPQLILDEAIPALQKLKEQGKVRYIGITGYPLDLLSPIATLSQIDTVLSYCHYNLLNTSLNEDLLPLVDDKGLGLINASVLYMGLLTDGGVPDWHPASQSARDIVQEAAEVARKLGENISKLAIQFAFHNSPAHTTLIGMKTAQQVEENLKIVDSKPNQEALESILAVLQQTKNVAWISGFEENYHPKVIEFVRKSQN